MPKSLEFLVSNALSGMRRETLNGREYIVRNMVLIVPGVLPGSRGPLLYKPNVVGRRTDTWNAMPLVGYHPRSTGKHRTARDPEVLDKQGLGFNFRTSFKDTLNSEGWFDVENVARFDKTLAKDIQLLPRLESKGQIELSTGLFTVHNTAKGKHSDGRDYVGEVENMEPDHVAILPDKVGACSIKDGCGVIVNELSAEHTSKLFLPCEGGWKVFNEGEYKECDCADKEDCKCAKEEKPTKNSFFKKLHKYLMLTGVIAKPVKNETQIVPDPVPILNEVTDMAKKDTVTWLTANCACWKGQEKTLEAMDEKVLDNLKADAEKLATLTANAATPSKPTAITMDLLPPELVALVNSAKTLTDGAKATLITELLENVAADKKEAAKVAYESMTVNQLQSIKDVMPKIVLPKPRPTNFAGQAAGGSGGAAENQKKSVVERPLARPKPYVNKAFAAKFN